MPGLNEFTVFARADGKPSPLRKFGHVHGPLLTFTHERHGDIVQVYANSTLTGVEQPRLVHVGDEGSSLRITPKVMQESSAILPTMLLATRLCRAACGGAGMEARSLN